MLLCTLLSGGIACAGAGEWTTQRGSLGLTPEEEAWIRAHPVVRCAPDPDFPPAEYFTPAGEYRGLVADYLNLVLGRVGLEMQIVRFPAWTHVLDYAKDRRIDLVTAASKTHQREEFLDFSNPFVELPAVIIVRQQVDRELTVEQLRGMKVSVVKKYVAHDFIARNHPYLNLDLVPDIQTGLRKVSFGMVDAMVANIATVSYYIEKGMITNLKVAGETGFTYKLSFAPRKDWPELTSILNKGLASLTSEEKREIYGKWIRLERPSVIGRKMLITLIVFSGVVFLMVLVVLGWNKSLRTIVNEKVRELKKEVVEHEEAKQAIAESENRYRGIFEYTKAGVAVYEAVGDGEDFVGLDCNRSVEIIDRLTTADFAGKSIRELFPGIEAFGLFSVIRKVWRTGVPSHFPAAFYRDDRIEGWRDYFIYRLPSNEIVTVYSDETDRIAAEKALREGEEKLAGIVNAVNDHMVMLDEELNIIWANNKAREVFGGNLENRKCHEIFAGFDRPCDGCSARRCFEEGGMKEREINLAREDGASLDFWEATNAASLNDRGLPKTVVTVFRDITKRKALAAEAMRAGHLASIGELAAGVAHEINNPINSVINLAQILRNEDKKKGVDNDIARRMINEGTRIADIVSSLLAFAKNKEGSKKPLSMGAVMDETLALTEVQLVKSGISLTVDLPEDLPRIFGHMQQIQQVFLNLINNARFALSHKEFRDGAVKTLKISGEKVTVGERECLRVLIEDNGLGIPEAVIGRIMDPFFTTKPGGEGTGLGLSISHGIIGDHRGRMKIESREGEYTRVIIELPAGEES